MSTDLRKKAKSSFEKDFLSWGMIQFLQKLWKIWENIEILNLSQQKEEETIWSHNKVIKLQKFFTENLLAIEMKKKTEILTNKFVHLGLSILELSKIFNVWVLVWLCKTKIWWKSKIVLYGYR